MSILQIARDVADEIGVIAPSRLIGAADLGERRFLAATKAAGAYLWRQHAWSVLHREYVFSTADGVDNYAVPDDWGRPQLPPVAWDRSQLIRMRGSRSPGQWQTLKSGLLANSTLWTNFRLLAGPLAASILIDPVPSSVRELVIEYVSRYWLEDTAGDGKPEPTVDTDEVRIDHEIYRLELLWRAKNALGLSYGDARADAMAALTDAIKADLALPVMRVARPPSADLDAERMNIPDGNFIGS